MDFAAVLAEAARLPAAAAALLYADVGLKVLSCAAGAKRPLTAHGVSDATADPRRLAAWWGRWPHANVAIATGGDGWDVIDVDRRPSGSGFAALRRARGAGVVDGWAAVVRTPSGGLHLYFAADPQRPQRSWAAPRAHVDFRGTGGYVLVPPSRVVGAAGSGSYELLGAGQVRGRVDALALRAVVDPVVGAARAAPGRDATAPDGSKIAGWLASRQEGTRNSALFWAACRYAETNRPYVDAQEELGAAAAHAGLEPGEIAATIRSAYRTSGPPSTSSARSTPRSSAGRAL